MTGRAAAGAGVAGRRLTVDEFIAWAMERPEGERYELVDGEIVAMAPERSGHALAKAACWLALRDGAKAAGLECQAYPDGMTVRVDAHTAYEPDALLRCGPRLPDDAVEVADPLVVVEVVSPSSASVDSGEKLEGYFRLPGLAHYLVVATKHRRLVHHRRTGDGRIETRALAPGETLALDPPGLSLAVEALFDAG